VRSDLYLFPPRSRRGHSTNGHAGNISKLNLTAGKCGKAAGRHRRRRHRRFAGPGLRHIPSKLGSGLCPNTAIIAPPPPVTGALINISGMISSASRCPAGFREYNAAVLRYADSRLAISKRIQSRPLASFIAVALHPRWTISSAPKASKNHSNGSRSPGT